MGTTGLPFHASAITLEQLQVYEAVVDSKSFSAAARALRKTQSAVSYHVGCLEEQLGVTLFDRSRRRPTLTPEGEALLAHARRVLASVNDLRSASRALTTGLEPRVVLAFNVLFPADVLAAILAELGERFPSVDVTALTSASRQETPAAIRDGRADLGIISYLDRSDDLAIEPCATVEMVPVVAPTHPVAQHRAPIDDDALQEHVHLILGDDPGPEVEDVVGFPSTRRWRTNVQDLRLSMLRSGVGWGRMPRNAIEADLRRGTLVPVGAKRWGTQTARVELFVARLKRRSLGPAGQWLWQRLAQLPNPDAPVESPLS